MPERFVPLARLPSVRERAAEMRARLDRRIGELEGRGESAAQSVSLDTLKQLRARVEQLLADLDVEAEAARLERRRN